MDRTKGGLLLLTSNPTFSAGPVKRYLFSHYRENTDSENVFHGHKMEENQYMEVLGTCMSLLWSTKKLDKIRTIIDYSPMSHLDMASESTRRMFKA